MDIEILEAKRRADPRGWLLKVLMRGQLAGAREFGEIYVVRAEPGECRGGHVHDLATEWFCLLEGRAELALRDLRSGERRELALDAAAPATVRVGPGVAHVFRNPGPGPFLLLAYSDRPYDAAATDTVAAEV
jgi:dTDP-4-dehydrorhamnose 3,5-epimerase